MGQELVADPRTRALAIDESATSLLIAVPFYRNERLVPRFVDSLIACAEEIRALDARVILLNDSPSYAPLTAALNEAVAKIGTGFPVEVRTNPTNLGWLKTANIAMREAAARGADVILFNSDTVIFPGALREMAAVSRLDPMTGFVNPRSNNATLANFPIGERFERMGPAEAEAAFRASAGTLPRVTYAPTGVGFALLVKRIVIEEFGVFDEIYGGGYNEENDLVMRAGRCGYRAVLANRAFVWHEGEQSLGAGENAKAKVEAANRNILVSRYPEYPALVTEWFNGVEYTVEKLMSALVPGPHGRLRIAFDFSSFGNYHSGTQKAGAQLLQIAAGWKDRYDVFVICEPEPYRFHGFDRMGVARCNPHDPETFAAIFRVGQPFDWDAVRRLSLKSAVVGVFMLDTIALDCSHLSAPVLKNLWRHVLTHSDFVLYNSAFTEQQFMARFPDVEPKRHMVSLHSLDLDDYRPPQHDDAAEVSEEVRNLGEGYVLVVGNHYPHKAVGEAANRIAAARPDLKVVALGVTREKTTTPGAPPGVRGNIGPADDRLASLPNLAGLRVGGISDADMDYLQRHARLIVMPSHYEGFGLPVPIALSLKKPIVVRAIPSLIEVHRALGSDPNVHFFETTAELVKRLENLPVWIEKPSPRIRDDAERAAQDVRALLEASLAAAGYESISGRFGAIHSLLGARHHLVPPAANPPDAIARRIGAEVERATARLLRNRFAYGVMRFFFRLSRLLTGRGWSRR